MPARACDRSQRAAASRSLGSPATCSCAPTSSRRWCTGAPPASPAGPAVLLRVPRVSRRPGRPRRLKRKWRVVVVWARACLLLSVGLWRLVVVVVLFRYSLPASLISGDKLADRQVTCLACARASPPSHWARAQPAGPVSIRVSLAAAAAAAGQLTHFATCRRRPLRRGTTN